MKIFKQIFTSFGILAVIAVLVYGAYRKGYAEAIQKGVHDYQTEYGNDTNGDVSVMHSPIYSIAYARGNAAGEIKARAADFVRCNDKLTQIIVETRNSQIAGQLLASGDITTSQLKKAEEEWKLNSKR